MAMQGATQEQPDPKLEALIQALLLNEQEIVAGTKRYASDVLFRALEREYPGHRSKLAPVIEGFFRELVARPIGERLGVIIAICLPDGGKSLCIDRLNYCAKREKLRLAAADAQSLILTKFGANGALLLKDKAIAALKERLSEEEFTRLMSHLHELSENLGPLIEMLKGFDAITDLAVPFATPITVALFILLYALDEVCLCDKPPEQRNYLRI